MIDSFHLFFNFCFVVVERRDRKHGGKMTLGSFQIKDRLPAQAGPWGQLNRQLERVTGSNAKH